MNQLLLSVFWMTMKSSSIKTGSSRKIFGESFELDVDIVVIVVVVTSTFGPLSTSKDFSKKAEKMMLPDLQFSSFSVRSSSF